MLNKKNTLLLLVTLIVLIGLQATFATDTNNTQIQDTTDFNTITQEYTNEIEQTATSDNNEKQVMQTENSKEYKNIDKNQINNLNKTLKKDSESYAFISGNLNYSSLKNDYYISEIRYADFETMSEYGIDVPINITVNGETHSLEHSYDIHISTSLFDENNPIFTTYGEHNLTISFNDSYYGEWDLNETIIISDDAQIYYYMYNNGTYLDNYYNIGNVRYGSEFDYKCLDNFPLNLTVNGERRELTTDYNGNIIIDNNTFNNNNPIFTTVGNNNITISANDEKYGELLNNTIFNVNSTPKLYTTYYDNPTYLDDYYTIVILTYGNENNPEYLNIPINLTVNGETKTIEIFGNVAVSKNNFSSDNPIFTTSGENNITISFDHEKYGKYNDSIIFTTVKASLVLDELKDKYENIKFININWNLNAYSGSRIVNIVINNQSTEVNNYYNYNQDLESENFTYKFVPDSPGNYSVYIEVTGDSGDFNSSIEEFEIVSVNPNKLKLNVTLEYNKTAYLSERIEIKGVVFDETGEPYIGNYKFEWMYFNTDKNGEFTAVIDTRYDETEGIITPKFIFSSPYDPYYEETSVNITINLTNKIINDSNLGLVWNHINDTEYGDIINISGILYDSNGNPANNVKITFFIDSEEYSSDYTYSNGKFYHNAYKIINQGEHNISAVVQTVNGPYISNTTFNIVKIQPVIEIYGEDERENIHSLKLNGYVSHFDTDNLYIKVNNQTYTIKHYGDWELKIPINETGDYYIEAFIPEGINTFYASTSKIITVKSINSTPFIVNLTLDKLEDMEVGSSISIQGYVTDEEGNNLNRIPILITLNSDTYSFTDIYNTYNGYYSKTLYDIPQGDYHVQVRVNDIDYENVTVEQDFSITIDNFDTATYEMKNNNTYLDNYYNIGNLYTNGYEGKPGISLNVTVNGETQNISTSYDGEIIIDTYRYNENNPIFTTAGNNNITLQVNGEKYNYFKENVIFTTTEANVIWSMNQADILRDNYYVATLKYGNENYNHNIGNELINVTVNGEQHEITTYYGNVFINSSVFRSDNPIFTTAGDNNITISFINNRYYGNYIDTKIYTTYEPHAEYMVLKADSHLSKNYEIGYLRYGHEKWGFYGMDIPINLTVNGETHEVELYYNDYDGTIAISNNVFSKENPIFTTPCDNNITISFNNSEYGEYSYDTTLTTTDSHAFYKMINNGTYLAIGLYDIGYLYYGNETDYESLTIPINVTVNGETQSIVNDAHYGITIAKSDYNEENPIFTTPGDNNITISFNNSEYGEYSIDVIFTTTEAYNYFNIGENGTILKDNYHIGSLHYGNENAYRNLNNVLINLTINNETHEVYTDYYGDIYVDTGAFNKYNPIFTTIGDNNITISFNNEYFGEYENSTIFTTIPAEIFVNENNNTLISKNYYMGTLCNGTEVYSNILSNVNLNITVNGETHSIYSNEFGYIKIDTNIFSIDNPIFTTVGNNNITISLNNSTLGEYYKEYILSTYGYVIQADPIDNVTVNDTIIVRGYLYDTYSNPLDWYYISIFIDDERYEYNTGNDGYYQYSYQVTSPGLHYVTISADDSMEYDDVKLEFYAKEPQSIEEYVKELEDKLKEYEDLIKQLNDTINYQTQIIEQLNDSNNDLQEQLNKFNDKIADLESQVSNLTGENDVLNTQLDNVTEQLSQAQNTIDNQTNTINSLEKQVENATKEINDLKDKLNQSNANNTQLKEQLTQLNNTKNNLENELNNSQQQLEQAQDNITNLEKQLSILKDNNTKLENELKELNNTKKELESQLASANNNLSKANDKITQQENTIKNLEKELNNTKANNTELQDQLTQAKQNNTKLQQQLKDSQEEADKLQEKLDDTTKEINNLEKQLNNTKDTIAQQNKTIKDQNKQIKTLNDTIKQQTTALNAANKEIKELTQKLADTNKTLNTTITISPITGKVGSLASIESNVIDEDGNPVDEGYVLYKIGGVTLKDENGNILYSIITKGTATLNYKVPKSWYGKNLTVSALYKGTHKFYSSRTETTDLNITTGKVNLKIADQPSRENGEKTQFVITATDEAGNNVRDGQVLIKINGVTLKDANGKVILAQIKNGLAIIDYKLNLSNKVHNITAVYTNKGYDRTEAVNTLNVTKGEAFIRINPIQTKTNTTQITASIVDKNKENINSVVTVAIKLNGRTIKIVTATNGVINTTIDTNFKVGSYLLDVIIGETGKYKSDRVTTTIIKS